MLDQSAATIAWWSHRSSHQELREIAFKMSDAWELAGKSVAKAQKKQKSHYVCND